MENLGTGLASVRANNYLTGILGSTGDIEYYGTLNLDINITGTGQLIQGTDTNCDVMTTSIAERQSYEDKLVVYPNPSMGTITIEGSQRNFKGVITSITGHAMENLYISNFKTTLNVSHFPPGVYILKTNQETKLFIKQ